MDSDTSDFILFPPSEEMAALNHLTKDRRVKSNDDTTVERKRNKKEKHILKVLVKHKTKVSKAEPQIGGSSRGGNSRLSFACPICGKVYARKWTLRRHEKSQHEGELDHNSNHDSAVIDNDEKSKDSAAADENESGEEAEDSQSDELTQSESDDDEDENESQKEGADDVEMAEDDGDVKNKSAASKDIHENHDLSEPSIRKLTSSVASQMSHIIKFADINCHLQLVSAGELGKLQLTTDALRSCYSVFKSKTMQVGVEMDEDDDHGYFLGEGILRMLKEMLLSAKHKHIMLTNEIYLSVLDAIDIAQDVVSLTYD